jgi:hypothetical protein
MATKPAYVRREEEWIKCNLDAGFHMEQGVSTIACCARNNRDVFLCAQTRRYNSRLSTLEGKDLALLDAVQLAIQHRWSFIVFEGDSQTLVNSIRSNNVGISEFVDSFV